MKTFIVKTGNLHSFIKMMNKINPDIFAYSKYTEVDDRWGYHKVTFLNTEELKELGIEPGIFPIVGRKYRVTGGEEESGRLSGNRWFFTIGEIIICTEIYPNGSVDFESVGRGVLQSMDFITLPQLIEPFEE